MFSGGNGRAVIGVFRSSVQIVTGWKRSEPVIGSYRASVDVSGHHRSSLARMAATDAGFRSSRLCSSAGLRQCHMEMR